MAPGAQEVSAARKREKVDVDVGNAKVTYTGQSLYFTADGGDFQGDGVKGMFTHTVGGAAVIVYIEDDDGHEMNHSYMVDVKDIIAVAIAHHKKMKR